MFWIPVGLIWVLAMSILTLILFWWDKQQSRTGGWRIAESTLLTLALIGGAPGAKYGQRAFRHKTRKEPFRTTLNLILVLQFTVLVALWVVGPSVLVGIISTISEVVRHEPA